MPDLIKKFPRIPHLSHSECISEDDLILASDHHFKDKDVVVTLKMDGSQTSLYSNYQHARSLDSSTHESCHWLKNRWGQIKHLIPDDICIIGENLFAVHTIEYTELPDYFLAFAARNIDGCYVSWDDTINICQFAGLRTVPVIWEGRYDFARIKNIYAVKSKYLFGGINEGFVIRTRDWFKEEDFSKNVAKFVTKQFKDAISEEHWMKGKLKKNKLHKPENSC